MAEAVAWHEVRTDNGGETQKFYTELFGWGTEGMSMGDMGVYTMFTTDGKPFAGIIDLKAMGMEGTAPGWTVYFNCDDVDAGVAKVIAMGGKVFVPAMEVPTVGRMACVGDPQGTSFWLFKGEAK